TSTLSLLFFFVMLQPPPRSTLFPYTTLFRSAMTDTATETSAQPKTAIQMTDAAARRIHELGQSESADGTTMLRVAVLGGGCSGLDRKSTRLNSSHVKISYAVFCLKKKKINHV